MDVGGIVTGIGGGTILTALAGFFFNRRKLSADTASVLSQAATNLVQPLSDQIDRLEKKVKELESRVESLSTELDAAHDLNRHKDDLIAAFVREKAERAPMPPNLPHP